MRARDFIPEYKTVPFRAIRGEHEGQRGVAEDVQGYHGGPEGILWLKKKS